jgi:glutathione synthase/RimK-type ligase-like ATP-grasp enzyme
MSGTTLADHALQQRNELHARGLAALASGERAVARSFFTKSVVDYPQDALSHSHLAYALLLENEFDAARILYEKAIELDSALANAYHGIALLYEKMGNTAECERYRAQGLRLRPLTTLRYEGSAAPIDVLLLGAKGSSNIDTKRFFDPQHFRVHALAVEYAAETQQIPKFDICFNAIGEADSAHLALITAKRLLSNYPGRVLNHPDIVLRTGRITVAHLLRGINGIRTPRIIRVSRNMLEADDFSAVLAAHDLVYPFLLRTPGHHTGKHFLQIRSSDDIPIALETLPGNEFFAMEFLDARSDDGLIRKYRVLSIGGELYPIHLAVASQWKVHYFSAKTEESLHHRKEEEFFLERMPQALGELTMIRLRGIARLIGLDYGGIDFSIAPDGSLYVYEANATMGFAEPSQHPNAEYRRPAIIRAHQAVRNLLFGLKS